MMTFHKLFNKIARRTDYKKMELRMYHAYMRELYPEMYDKSVTKTVGATLSNLSAMDAMIHNLHRNQYGSEVSPFDFDGDILYEKRLK